MKIPPRKKRRGLGFTIIELTVAMGVGMTIAALVLAIFNQQLAFLRIFRVQGFLNEEAPIISLHVSRLLGKADRFRLHDSVADARNGLNPRLNDSPVLLMKFRQPNGEFRDTILSFEDRGDGPALYHYVVPLDGALGDPQWAVTNKPENVRFFMDEGVLRMRLTGPAGEQVIYSGTMQQ